MSYTLQVEVLTASTPARAFSLLAGLVWTPISSPIRSIWGRLWWLQTSLGARVHPPGLSGLVPLGEILPSSEHRGARSYALPPLHSSLIILIHVHAHAPCPCVHVCALCRPAPNKCAVRHQWTHRARTSLRPLRVGDGAAHWTRAFVDLLDSSWLCGPVADRRCARCPLMAARWTLVSLLQLLQLLHAMPLCPLYPSSLD